MSLFTKYSKCMGLIEAQNILEFRKITGYNGYLPLWFLDSYNKYVTFRNSSNKKYLLLYDDVYVIPILIRK